MKYYKLIESINNKEIGVYPQSLSVKNITDIQKFGFGFYNEIQEKFSLPEPILQKKAKLTNYLGVIPINSMIFKIIDDELFDFIINYNLPKFQKWKIKTHHNGAEIDKYNLFHLSHPFQDKLIDFKHSVFMVKNISNIMAERKQYLNYYDYQTDWKKLIWTGSVIAFDILYLDFSKLNEDLIRIIDIDSVATGFYVSERLKNAIEKERFTGFAFQEIEEMDKRIKVIY